MEMYALMMKGIISELDDNLQEKYKVLLEQYSEQLSNLNEDESLAAMTAMIVALVDSGLLED